MRTSESGGHCRALAVCSHSLLLPILARRLPMISSRTGIESRAAAQTKQQRLSLSKKSGAQAKKDTHSDTGIDAQIWLFHLEIHEKPTTPHLLKILSRSHLASSRP